MKLPTLIVGNGAVARKIAGELSEKGVPVLAAAGFNGPEKKEKTTLPMITACNGCMGRFAVDLVEENGKTSLSADQIVIAGQGRRLPAFDAFGLFPSDSVVSLFEVEGWLRGGRDPQNRIAEGKTFVFVTGLFEESRPVILEWIMRCAINLRVNFSIRTYVMTKNLKVGAEGLEALYHESREAGVIYIKTTLPPEFEQGPEKTVITFIDEVMRRECRITPDVLVVDEILAPDPGDLLLADRLSLDIGKDGFLQNGNVHRSPVFTNRKGVMVAGPSRGVFSEADCLVDAENVVCAVLDNIREAGNEEGRAKITGSCVRCLTCVRVCHYGAVILNPVPEIMPRACESCGACIAECPRQAITIPGVSFDIEKMQNGISSDSVIAICCARSAYIAGKTAMEKGFSLPGNLHMVSVPCAASISQELLFSAFQKAKGVLVLTCHEGNCHSETGNISAERRVGYLKGVLRNMGIDPARLMMETVSGNMPAQFAGSVEAFVNRLSGNLPFGRSDSGEK